MFIVAKGGQSMLPRIGYLALLCNDPAPLAGFYRAQFGLDELGRSPDGDVSLKHVGGGYNKVAIQTFYSEEEGHEARFGIAHFGFLAPDSKAMAERVQGDGATVKPRPAVRTQSEARMRDPEGNGCDLSQRGWEV